MFLIKLSSFYVFYLQINVFDIYDSNHVFINSGLAAIFNGKATSGHISETLRDMAYVTINH